MSPTRLLPDCGQTASSPLAGDLDVDVGHLDGGLVVDRTRRPPYGGGLPDKPRLLGGHRTRPASSRSMPRSRGIRSA